LIRKKVILITGACGEIGQALVDYFLTRDSLPLVTLDLHDKPAGLWSEVSHFKGSINDRALIEQLVSEFEFDAIYHLAALLSTRAEFTPITAHTVNVEGTLRLLELASGLSEFRGQPVKFMFPSSIATYGLPNLDTKQQYPKVREWEWNYPTTMYGANKLYCELLGTYFSQHYQQLAERRPVMVDFRAVRFPGLVSAFTMPSGGTSDFGPEMLHAAAKGEPYACFVRPDSTIPFMAMPDAVKALIQAAEAPAEKLSRRVYNVSAFSLSAEEFRQQVQRYFPQAQIEFQPHAKRQSIVDSWPTDVDDSLARRDWGWQPDYELERCFAEYLVPEIKKRYQK